MPASPRIASTADVARRLQPVVVGGDILAYSYVRELHRAYGVERVMFGSDFPMWSPVTEYYMLAAMPFTQEEFEAITWHNAERFIGQEI